MAEDEDKDEDEEFLDDSNVDCATLIEHYLNEATTSPHVVSHLDGFLRVKNDAESVEDHGCEVSEDAHTMGRGQRKKTSNKLYSGKVFWRH